MLDRLSRGQLVGVMDIATRCLSASTYEQLQDIISRLGDVIVFRKAALCAVRPSQDEPLLEHYINHSYGARWEALYTRERMQSVDPILAYCLHVDGAFRWRDAMSKPTNPTSASFLEAAQDFGLVDGVSYTCASGPNSPRTVLSLTDADAGDPDGAIQVLSALGPHVHEAYKRILQLQCADATSPVLSPREREVLIWTQQGKTYWEIGCILGISQRTVKYHFSRIKQKLDVVNASHAIAKAMRLGIVG